MRAQQSNKVASKKLLQTWCPNVLSPVIISAPTYGSSNGELAAKVSKAGGLGIVPAGFDFTPGNAQLETLANELSTARAILSHNDSSAKDPSSAQPLPLGVGFILCHASVRHFAETAVPVLTRFRPRAVWLFAPNPDLTIDGQTVQAHVAGVLRQHGFLVIVQVGTVAAARQAVLDGADVVVAQGVDAGGHQFASGGGVISLVPEVRTMLDEEFPGREVALVAAGGIVDGRGVVAALALGAEAAVMGTRFIVAQESKSPEHIKKAILATVDGGTNTAKSDFHDAINSNSSLWHKFYDGRAVIGKSYQDHLQGVSMEDNLARFKEAQKSGDTSRAVTWSGTGVGLVRQTLPATDIVTQTREEARQRIQALASLL